MGGGGGEREENTTALNALHWALGIGGKANGEKNCTARGGERKRGKSRQHGCASIHTHTHTHTHTRPSFGYKLGMPGGENKIIGKKN